jgi:hypothetical protein
MQCLWQAMHGALGLGSIWEQSGSCCYISGISSIVSCQHLQHTWLSAPRGLRRPVASATSGAAPFAASPDVVQQQQCWVTVGVTRLLLVWQYSDENDSFLRSGFALINHHINARSWRA